MKELVTYKTNEELTQIIANATTKNKKVLEYYTKPIVTGYTEPKIHVDKDGSIIVDETPQPIFSTQNYVVVVPNDYEPDIEHPELVKIVKGLIKEIIDIKQRIGMG